MVLPATVKERVKGTIVFGCGWQSAYGQVELLGQAVLGKEGTVVDAGTCKEVAIWAAGETGDSASAPGDSVRVKRIGPKL